MSDVLSAEVISPRESLPSVHIMKSAVGLGASQQGVLSPKTNRVHMATQLRSEFFQRGYVAGLRFKPKRLGPCDYIVNRLLSDRMPHIIWPVVAELTTREFSNGC